MLYREPMWLKCTLHPHPGPPFPGVSVLYREPMWLKSTYASGCDVRYAEFQCSTVSRCG